MFWLVTGSAAAELLEQSNTQVISADVLPNPHPPLYGLAAMYDSPRPVRVTNGWASAAAGVGELDRGDWIGWRTRSDAFLVSIGAGAFEVLDGVSIKITTPTNLHSIQQDEQEFSGRIDEFHAASLKYTGLWTWLRMICSPIEKLLLLLWAATGSLGIAVILLSICIKIVLLPLLVAQANTQNRVKLLRGELTPVLDDIRRNYDGEEAHQRIMAAHKQLGVSPFYATKPALFLMVQIPVLVAIFAVLGEFSEGVGTAFLWIDDLMLPDSVATLPMPIPGLGQQVSLLPLILALATALPPWFQNSAGPDRSREIRSATLLGLVFLALFYPFPALLVLYWTAANVAQIPLTAIMRRKAPAAPHAAI